jgi:SAM-dependent methyltransferase
MSDTDWEARYQCGDMPWEKGEASPGLVDFLAAHPELAREGVTVAVPGCGTGHDARVWAGAGFRTFGFDLAPSAVALSEQKSAALGLGKPRIQFRQMDFLAEDAGQQFDWLFEHTLFCAIDPARRAAYVEAVKRSLKPGGQFLAVHYMINDESGPPFGVSQQELMELFQPHFDFKAGWVPRAYPNRTGLELMLWWARKA